MTTWLRVGDAAKLVARDRSVIYNHICRDQLEVKQEYGLTLVSKDSLLAFYGRKYLHAESIREMQENGQAYLGPVSDFLTKRGTYFKAFLREVEDCDASLEQRASGSKITKELWLVRT